jgi:hypothetical protein
MKKDVVVLIIIVTAILAFLLGYSISPSPERGKKPSSVAAPGYDDKQAPQATAPGYDDEKPQKAKAPGYE